MKMEVHQEFAGNVLEKHLYLSKAKDGKRQPAEEVYYKNYLANRSEFIYSGGAPCWCNRLMVYSGQLWFWC